MLDIDRSRKSILVVFVCLLFAASLFRFVSIFDKSCESFMRFLNYKFDYHVLNESLYIPKAAAIVKQVVPPGSTVGFSYKKWDVYTVWFYYLLYPLEVKDNWDYFVDAAHSLTQEETKGMKTFNLGDEVKIYAKPGHDFNLTVPAPQEYPQGRNMAIFFLVTVFVTLVGSMILVCFRIPQEEGGAWWYWGTSYLIGFLSLTMPLWGFLMAGGMLTRMNILMIWSVLCAGIYLGYRRVSKGKERQAAVKIMTDTIKDIPLPWMWFKKLFHLLAIVVIITVVLDCISLFVTIWDEMALWILQAEMIFHQQRLDLHYTFYTYYPILWQTHIAAQFTLLGGMYGEVARWVSSLMFLALLGQLHGAMRFLRIPRTLLLSLLGGYVIVFYHPAVFHTALPENPLLAYIAASLTFILLWLRDTSKMNFIFLSLISAVGIACVKIEGAVAVVFYGAALLLLAQSVKFSRRSICLICMFFFIPAIPAGWIFWLKHHGYGVSLYHLSHGLSWQKIVLVGGIFKLKMLKGQNCLFILLSLVMLAVVKNQKPFSVQEKFLFLTFLALVGFSAVAALGWPAEDIYPYFMEASGRLLIHSSPFIFLFWCSRIFNAKINP